MTTVMETVSTSSLTTPFPVGYKKTTLEIKGNKTDVVVCRYDDYFMDRCFVEVTTNNVLMLFSFGDVIAKSKGSSEKLFVLLDMYEIMRELHSEIETIFEGKTCSEMRDATHNLLRCLVQTAQKTFGDLKEVVEEDVTKTGVMDGTVHPLTRKEEGFASDPTFSVSVIFGKRDEVRLLNFFKFGIFIGSYVFMILISKNYKISLYMMQPLLDACGRQLIEHISSCGSSRPLVLTLGLKEHSPWRNSSF
ncbi:hypothetical protein M5K25_017006 [Dendrobium thyrsiflorum]|uniref:Exocyst subunit Exo70 family protein n=1 Tax=Dendrobium thyrsiflorum TaxID=117978 RepID=A0ABD0UTD8_DENTH